MQLYTERERARSAAERRRRPNEFHDNAQPSAGLAARPAATTKL